MNREKAASVFLVLLSAAIIVGTVFGIINYANTVLASFVNFIATNDFNQLKECGVTPPPAVAQVKQDLAPVIVPFVYMGMPLILVALSLFMFIAGIYHERWKAAEARQARRPEERRHHAEREED